MIGSNLTRIVGEQIYPDGSTCRSVAWHRKLQIGRMSVPAEVEAEWNAWYNGEYIPAIARCQGDLRPPLSGPRGHQRVYHGL